MAAEAYLVSSLLLRDEFELDDQTTPTAWRHARGDEELHATRSSLQAGVLWRKLSMHADVRAGQAVFREHALEAAWSFALEYLLV